MPSVFVQGTKPINVLFVFVFAHNLTRVLGLLPPGLLPPGLLPPGLLPPDRLPPMPFAPRPFAPPVFCPPCLLPPMPFAPHAFCPPPIEHLNLNRNYILKVNISDKVRVVDICLYMSTNMKVHIFH